MQGRSDRVEPRDKTSAADAGEEHAWVAAEARTFYLSLFGKDADRRLVEEYIAVHRALPEIGAGSTDQQRTVACIVNRRLDAPAIEPWLRRRAGGHILTRKLHLICYLAECDADHQQLFGRLGRPNLGKVGLAIMLLRAAARLAFGLFQKYRHDLL